MAVSTKWYGQHLLKQYNGTAVIDYDTDTMKIALLEDTYTPDQDAHDFFDDVSAHEVTGTGYTAGGATLANKAVTYTGATNILAFDADNPVWTITGTLTARYAVVYKDTGNEATSPLMCYIDFGQNETTTDSTFTVTVAGGGIIKITAS